MGIKVLPLNLLLLFMIPRCSGYPVVPDEIREKWPSGNARLNLIFIHATYNQLNGM